MRKNGNTFLVHSQSCTVVQKTLVCINCIQTNEIETFGADSYKHYSYDKKFLDWLSSSNLSQYKVCALQLFHFQVPQIFTELKSSIYQNVFPAFSELF